MSAAALTSWLLVALLGITCVWMLWMAATQTDLEQEVRRAGGVLIVQRPPFSYERFIGALLGARPEGDAYACLWGTEVDDAWIARNLSSLRSESGLELNLCRTNVGDDSVRQLTTLKELESLDLSETIVTDAGLQLFAKHPTLACLSVGGTPVTSTGLQFLPTLPELRYVGVDAAQLDEKLLVTLQGCPKLTSFILIKADDATVIRLVRHPSFRLLILQREAVTDQSLVLLATHPELTYLCLRDCAVTDAGVNALQLALPKLQVDRKTTAESEQEWREMIEKRREETSEP
ncbi:leucine-rich repeat domain-containing protein [Planctomicrobium piriforme]|uniref:Leucine Rich repeat-containing protein n=1 Tax=Planctomicrobium piriforme TaxID=1576369 RepID=A0A1I3T7S9_9PLAN|nr:hypothetical protein [Planctomicrobium piriforme]SFJ67198.1 hypothetical protein SAMN05421753_12827 [Planctomicrobium piriforme]